MEKMPDWHEELHSAMQLLEDGHPVNCLAALHAMLQDHGSDDLCRAMVFDGMGRALFMEQKPDLGLEAFNESLNILRKLKADGKVGTPLLLGSLQNLTHADMVAGKFDESLKTGKEALELAKKELPDNDPEIARVLFTLSAPYYEMKNYQAAEDCLLEAKKILEAQPGDPDPQIGTILNNLGRIYEERQELKHGIDYHRRAVEFRRALPDKADLAFSLGNYGVALGTDGQLAAASAALREAQVIYAALGLADTPEAQAFEKNLELFENVLNNPRPNEEQPHD